MNIGLLGFGTIGAGVYELCKRQPSLSVTHVLDLRDLGIPEQTASFDEILADPGVDTVVEVMGGLHPAYEFVKAALEAGKNVVTANKYLVATFYDELPALAKKKNVSFRCTASAGGGIGWLTALERARRVESVLALEGIMNGTTNYILSNMTENGLSFETVLKEAQSLGYAEAEPAADIDGLDILNKLLISANIAFGVSLRAAKIPVFGIRTVTAADIAAAGKIDRVVKITGRAKRTPEGIVACVSPVFLPENRPEAHVPSNFNLIAFEGGLSGRMSFIGQGAGRYPTAANVVQDCLDIAGGKTGFYTECFEKEDPVAPPEQSFYLRTTSKKAEIYREKALGAGIVTRPVRADAIREILTEDPAAFAAVIESEE